VKQTPLRRYASLQSRKPMRLRRARPRRESRVRDETYMAWVRTLPCCSPMPHLCRGVIDPHHAGVKPGLRIKADDDTCIPMCRRSHREFGDHAGVFAGWTRDRRRTWQDEMVARFQAAWERRQGFTGKQPNEGKLNHERRSQ
jgi:hypothetical protein